MMDSTVLKKFIASSSLLDRVAKEVFERLPEALRYRLYYGKTFLQWAAFLKESEYWTRERHEAFQFEELKALLVHASRDVPFYARLFPEVGFNPLKMQCLEDMKALPFVTKDMVRDRPDEFIARNISKSGMVRTTTGGSTGIPLVIYRTRESIERSQAFLFNLLARVGYSPRKKVAFFQWRDIEAGRKRGLVFRKYGNKLVLSAAGPDRKRLRLYYDLITGFRPEFLSGYKTALLSFAHFLREEGIPPLNGIRAAFAYAEKVSPSQRRVLEESLGTRVFSTYGMYESVAFGGDCEHTDHCHLYPQFGISEYREIEGCSHELVGTGFGNYGMPLVRYRTMDMVTRGPQECRLCGRSHQLLEEIDGRMTDCLIDRRGRMIYPAIFGVDTEIFSHVRQFQFYQDEPGRAELRIVKMAGYSESDTGLIEHEVRRKFGRFERDLSITVVFTDCIPETMSGKTLMTDQRLRIDEGAGGAMDRRGTEGPRPRRPVGAPREERPSS